MGLFRAKDFEIDKHIEVIRAYLYESKSHRSIQREILGLPAPARGGGYVAMDILHFYDINDDKKGILKNNTIEDELKNASSDYKKALKLISDYNSYENRVINTINGNDFDIPQINTESVSNIKIRIGQNLLRKVVLKNYNNTCALCNINIIDLLVCSHIKPWAIDDKNRLNQSNSICLCTWHDSLFDKGYISFDENYKLLISKLLPENIQKELELLDLKFPKKQFPEKNF